MQCQHLVVYTYIILQNSYILTEWKACKLQIITFFTYHHSIVHIQNDYLRTRCNLVTSAQHTLILTEWVLGDAR